MRNTVALTLLFTACTRVGASHEFSIDDAKAIRKVLENQAKAWNDGDLEGFMGAGYVQSDELVFTSGGTIRRGYEPTLERYRSRYGTPGSMGKLDFTGLEIERLGPDAAWVLGRFDLSETPEESSGTFTLILVRTPEGWRILHDHTSADPKPNRSETSTPGATVAPPGGDR
ncbi:MAG: DUF4440 domain-containing protein [Myxococcota bacterium]